MRTVMSSRESLPIRLLVQALKILPVLTPFIAFGQGSLPQPFTTAVGINDFIACTVTGVIFYFAIAFSIVMVLFGAFKYLTSGGNETKVSEATQTITYAVVGIVVAVIAGGVPAIIGSLFPGDIGISITCS
jgi:hypothetical protein